MVTGDKRTGPKKYGLAVVIGTKLIASLNGVTGDKRTGKKKSLAVAGITDENGLIAAQPCQFFKNSTNIRSESYWHQINCLV